MRNAILLDTFGHDAANRWLMEKEEKRTRKRKVLVYLILANVATVAMVGLFIALAVWHGNSNGNDEGSGDANDKNENNSHVVTHCRKVKHSPGWRETSNRLLSNLEPTVEPCMNFYQYACDGWSYRHPLRAGQASYTIYDDVKSRLNMQIKLAIGAINKYLGIQALNKLRYAFNTCMDTDSLNSLHGSPFLKFLKDIHNPIGGWPLLNDNPATVHKDWQTVPVESRIGYLKTKYGIDTLIFTYVRQDDINSSSYALELSGSMLPLGLGMFKAIYYTNNTAYEGVMRAYTNLIENTVNLLKQELSHADRVDRSEVVAVVEFERRLANATLVARDLDIDYGWNVNTLRRQLPNFDWNLFFEALLPDEVHSLLAQPERLILRVTPSFLGTVNKLLTETKPTIVQNYLMWRLMRYSMPFLGKEYRGLIGQFDAFVDGKVLQWPEQRHDECIRFVNGRNHLPGLGYVTGRAYVDYTFSIEDRERMEEVADDVRSAYKEIISNLKWLDTRTRRRAMAKLDKMRQNIGFPRWISNNELLDKYYERLEIGDQDNAWKVYLNTRSWSVKKNFRLLLSSTVKGDDFGGSPTATNAWYNPLLNAISLPAGEIQPPFYKQDYPKAVVYATLGSVIGHEMTHAFDRNGAKFDENGKETNWWSSESKARFKNATECLIKDYNHYCYHSLTLCIDGKKTLNENMADFGGLVAAYKAYKQWQRRSGGPEPSLPYLDMTMDQVFFLNYASFWCGLTSENKLKNQLLTDKHSPGKYRVLGPLRNFEHFAKAFNCPLDSYMNPPNKCNIWPTL